ncbi:MAG: hypothetical protein N2170_06390 [Bacteroidia bacterium]|nr:hypothetical protein [Bacteroidia bacterium]
MLRYLWIGLWSWLCAQPTLPYTQLHRKLFPLVQDTSQRTWLFRLRETMEEVRQVEWNDRFFREIVSLYLQQTDFLPLLLGTVRRYVGVDSAALLHLFRPVEDNTGEAAVLSAAFQELLLRDKNDTTQTGYIRRQMCLLAMEAIQCWISTPEKPPLAPIVSAALRGYLKALVAAYAFFGFDASKEPWPQKMHIIEAIGLLEYYAYGESANAYRAWKRKSYP